MLTMIGFNLGKPYPAKMDDVINRISDPKLLCYNIPFGPVLVKSELAPFEVMPYFEKALQDMQSWYDRLLALQVGYIVSTTNLPFTGQDAVPRSGKRELIAISPMIAAGPKPSDQARRDATARLRKVADCIRGLDESPDGAFRPLQGLWFIEAKKAVDSIFSKIASHLKGHDKLWVMDVPKTSYSGVHRTVLNDDQKRWAARWQCGLNRLDRDGVLASSEVPLL